MSRYETLNVSLQTDNLRNQSRLSQTVDHENQRGSVDADTDNNQSDERVRKFRQLYYKNEKLRRELKLLNEKLNEKLEKVKFPAVKKRAASVDLNRQPPNKAQQRQLENAYKQIMMYKNQIQTLKIKEQTPENYAKVRDMENLIAFRDKEIAEVQEQLKSIKNIKKMQQKRIASELENEEVKQRLESYEKEHKQLKERLKEIARKSRKRQEEYKKQQAYLVSLNKKYRVAIDDKALEEEPPAQKSEPLGELQEKQFREIKQTIANQKRFNDQILKKTEILKKQIKALRDDINVKQESYKQKDALSKTLQTKIIALNRLLREEERKPKQHPANPLITNIEDVQLKQQQLNESFSEVHEEPKQQPNYSKQDLSLKKMLNQMEAGEREWKGKYRKIEQGFGAPGDKKFQFQGVLIGLQVSLDESEAICGISFVFEDKKGQRQEPVQGKRSNVQLKWQLKAGDSITKLSGSFTQQSYLSELIVISRNGESGIFGSPSSQPFTFRLNEKQRISGCFGSVRQLGSDRRITELGFWIEKI